MTIPFGWTCPICTNAYAAWVPFCTNPNCVPEDKPIENWYDVGRKVFGRALRSRDYRNWILHPGSDPVNDLLECIRKDTNAQ